MDRKLILSLIIATLYLSASGQTLKFRAGANYGRFNKEIGTGEVALPVPVGVTNPFSTDFTHVFEPGFEAEVMQLWTSNIETGIECRYSKFSGDNDLPPYYNYCYSSDAPAGADFSQPIKYESSALNILLNFRYYLSPEGIINPFFKLLGGVSLVGTELNYQDESLWPSGSAGVLYAIGTASSDEAKEMALCYGAGLGFDYPINDRFSLHVGGSATIICSDKLDGIPNYDYVSDNGPGTLKPVNGQALVAQISVGIVFVSGIDLGLSKNSGSIKKGGLRNSGNTLPWRPFYRKK